MKEKTYITTTSIISAIVAVIALIFVIPNGVKMWQYSDRKDIGELTADNIKCGTYVNVEITEYIGHVVGHKFYGVSTTWIEIDGYYDVYTIPLKDGKYIRVKIKDSVIKNKLENYDMGKGEGVKFLGRIQKTDALDVAWYDLIEDVETGDVILGLAIKETEFKSEINFFGGVSVLTIAVIVFFKSLIHFDAIEHKRR